MEKEKVEKIEEEKEEKVSETVKEDKKVLVHYQDKMVHKSDMKVK